MWIKSSRLGWLFAKIEKITSCEKLGKCELNYTINCELNYTTIENKINLMIQCGIDGLPGTRAGNNQAEWILSK